jgi:tetratricopeptide (TPR) repeat protein
MGRKTVEATLFAVCLLFGPAGASAQSKRADAEYHEAITRALDEYNLGHWTEAKVFFREAHARKPSARTLRGIGLACYESRNYVEAIDYLGQALANSVQPLTPEMRNAALKLIEQSRQFVMRAEIELVPESAELFVDGKPVQLAADGSMLLDPGEHEISAIAPGYETAQRRVNTEGGSARQLHFVLKPRGARQQPLAAPRSEVRSELALNRVDSAASDSESVLPWLAIGGSVAVAATGGVLLGLGLSDKAAVEGTRDGASWESKKGANDRSVPLQMAGGVALGVGLAGLAASLAWQLWPSDERAVSLQVVPGAATLRTRF